MRSTKIIRAAKIGYIILSAIFCALGALLMSIMVGWEIKPKTLLDEIQSGVLAPGTVLAEVAVWEDEPAERDE